MVNEIQGNKGIDMNGTGIFIKQALITIDSEHQGKFIRPHPPILDMITGCSVF